MPLLHGERERESGRDAKHALSKGLQCLTRDSPPRLRRRAPPQLFSSSSKNTGKHETLVAQTGHLLADRRNSSV